MGSYLRPSTLNEALRALDAGPLLVVAGGTDVYPARVGLPLDDDVLDVTGIEALRSIEDRGDHFRMGALVSWTDVARFDLPPCFRALKQAALQVGGMQIQNAATIAGNLCNASPAADGIPCLMALDARVELTCAEGVRTLPVEKFVLGNRSTVRGSDELLTAVIVPKPAHTARSTFLKLGARAYLVISIVMVAIVLEESADGRIADARIAIGACAPVALRLRDLERDLRGLALAPRIADIVADRHLAPLAPIDDVRGTAAYRRDTALTLIRRGLRELAAG